MEMDQDSHDLSLMQLTFAFPLFPTIQLPFAPARLKGLPKVIDMTKQFR